MRDLISKRNGAGRGDMSAQFGIDLAKRLIRRAEQGLPVNPAELKLARQIVNGVKK